MDKIEEKSWKKYLENYAPLSYSEMIECCLLAEKEEAIKFAEFIGKGDWCYLTGLVIGKEFNEKWVNPEETQYLSTEELYKLFKQLQHEQAK